MTYQPASTSPRTTIAIVDRIESNGVVFVHEVDSKKLGVIANTTPVESHVRLRPGTRLSLDVEDVGNVMVVQAAREAPG
jgi:hypothetical protein